MTERLADDLRIEGMGDQGGRACSSLLTETPRRSRADWLFAPLRAAENYDEGRGYPAPGPGVRRLFR